MFANVDDSGCFEIAFPLTSEHQTVGLQTSPAAFVNQTFLASVNGTQEIVIDLHKMAANPQGHFCYYKGSNADINTAINTVERDSIGISYNKIMEFDGTTAMEFKSHISNLARAAEQYISQSNMPLKAKEYAKIDLRGNQGYYLGTAEIYMEMAYRKKHNIEDRRAPIPDFKRPQMGLQYAQYIQELNLCSPDMLFSNNLGNAISQFRFVAQSTMGSPLEVQRSVLKTMIDNGNSDEIAAKLLEITSSKAKEEKPAFSEEEIGIINQFNEKYMDEFANTAAQCQDAKIQEILGGCKGFFAECLKAQPILNTLRSRTPISGSGMKAIEEIGNPFITEYAKMLNSKLIDKIEADKARGGYFLHQTSETEADSILVDILKGHEGKVAYIDIWNTWCGPCRMGIEAMKRHHDEYKKKGVDFIYVADESSPEDEYNNTIVGMQGDHFRLSSEAMNKLSEKFDISGIPFYIFINKKGEVAATQSGFGGAEIILEKLDQLLAE